MMKNLCYLLCAFFVLGLWSCSKPVTPSPPGGGTTSYVLDSMVWKNIPQTTYFTYRADKLQDKAVSVYHSLRDTVSFEYNGQQISRIVSSRSRRTSNYAYHPSGKIASINLSGVGGIGSHYIFEFDYSAAGKLKTLNYFLQNEAGKKLQYACTYAYNTDGLVAAVTFVAPTGSTLTYTVEAYTPECNFNPWAFISPVELTEGFAIYNLPLLQDMKRLPAKITKRITGIESIEHVTATVQNNNLDKMISAFEYPGSPASNFQYEVNFFYHN
ncbi:MAG: hypothetical protein H7Y86_11000 [Rhizobacter sp.]|nr:hypothetical protein [Ferruginibacter sp.]